MVGGPFARKNAASWRRTYDKSDTIRPATADVGLCGRCTGLEQLTMLAAALFIVVVLVGAPFVRKNAASWRRTNDKSETIRPATADIGLS